MKNVQVRYKIYTNNNHTILYYPKLKGTNIHIGCQGFNDMEVLAFLAYKLNYNLNFCITKKCLRNSHGSVICFKHFGRKELLKKAGKTLFELICKEKGIEIK